VKRHVERLRDVIGAGVTDPHDDPADGSAEKSVFGHGKRHHLEIDVGLRHRRPGPDGHRPGRGENDEKDRSLDAKTSKHLNSPLLPAAERLVDELFD